MILHMVFKYILLVTFHGVGKIGYDNQGLYRAPQAVLGSDFNF